MKKNNKIYGLEDGNGKWIKEANEVEKMLCEYFTNIFTTTSPTSDQDQPFTEGEVAYALPQTCPTKAPGLDGLPTAFFRKIGA